MADSKAKSPTAFERFVMSSSAKYQDREALVAFYDSRPNTRSVPAQSMQCGSAFASIRPRSEQRLRESRRRDSMLSMMFKLA